MFRFSKLILIFAVACLFFKSCGVFDFRPVAVSTTPAAPLEILENVMQPLVIEFPSEPDRLAAERLLIVKSHLGNVEGDLSWIDNSLYFTPVKPWQPTVRYHLLYKGIVPMQDGREARMSADLPFFAVRAGEPPQLVSHSPLQDAAVNPVKGTGLVIVFTFSEAMDADSVRNALTIGPSIEVDYSWNADNTELTLSPKNALEPCAVYSWSIGTSALASDGAPFPREAEGFFNTLGDTARPEVVRCYPVSVIGGTWQETVSGAVLDDTRIGDALAVEMSEAIDPAGIATALRVEPSCAGRIDQVSPRLLVFIPERRMMPGASLSLTVSADIKDLSGLGMAKEYRQYFTVSTPYLRVLKIDTGETGESIDDPGVNSTLPVIVSDPEGFLSLSISFSERFSIPEQVALNARISLTPYFPSSLASPGVRLVAWSPDGTAVSIRYQGLKKSAAGIVNFYKLTVPGGLSGASAGNGVTMEGDVSLYLRAKP